MALPPNNGTQGSAQAAPQTQAAGTPPNNPPTPPKPLTKKPAKPYTDSELHDIFVKITEYLMDTGNVSVGDSKFTKGLRNFLNGGDHVDGAHDDHDNHSHNNNQKSFKAQHINSDALKYNLEHLKLDPDVITKIVSASHGTTIYDLMQRIDRDGIEIPKGMYGKVNTAIMNSANK